MDHYASFTALDQNNIETKIQVHLRSDIIAISLDFNDRDECERMKNALKLPIYGQTEKMHLDKRGEYQYTLAILTTDKKLATTYIQLIIKVNPNLIGFYQKITHLDFDIHEIYPEIDQSSMSLEGVKDEFSQETGMFRRLMVSQFLYRTQKSIIPLSAMGSNPFKGSQLVFLQSLLPKYDCFKPHDLWLDTHFVSLVGEPSSPPSSILSTEGLNAQICFLSWLSSRLCSFLPGRFSRDLNEDEKQKLTEIARDKRMAQKIEELNGSIISHPDLYEDQIDSLKKRWRFTRSSIKRILHEGCITDNEYSRILQVHEGMISKISELQSINDLLRKEIANTPRDKCLVIQYSAKKGGIRLEQEDLLGANHRIK
jgi:hypothetical protein